LLFHDALDSSDEVKTDVRARHSKEL
jgi:hypothetical protein